MNSNKNEKHEADIDCEMGLCQANGCPENNKIQKEIKPKRIRHLKKLDKEETTKKIKEEVLKEIFYPEEYTDSINDIIDLTIQKTKAKYEELIKQNGIEICRDWKKEVEELKEERQKILKNLKKVEKIVDKLVSGEVDYDYFEEKLKEMKEE